MDCPATKKAVWEADPAEGVCPLCGEGAEMHGSESDPLSADWKEWMDV